MPINSRAKGARAERELSHKLNEYGYQCRRTAQYCGNTGDAADVVGLTGIHIECKMVEKLNIDNAMEQAVRDARDGEFPTVFHRKNRRPWLVTMRLEDWIQLYRGWSDEQGLSQLQKVHEGQKELQERQIKHA